MPFNKGDFTQQGVAGHVNAILRLNEKRLVNIDLTTDEDAEGCTITGTVTDLLNDEVYEIGSGGGSELPTMKLTIVNTVADYVDFLLEDSPLPEVLVANGVQKMGSDVGPNETVTYDKIVYTADFDLATYFVNVPYDAIIAASDLVNCTYSDAVIPSFKITDPSEPSSATITLSHS